ncbi:hypothetical protein CDD83_3356 [Cordyceps sp. RAO-2017]|nr:hypothetical protein CDD83_3356 [Cordyceps sp. RAO-2017]
MPFLAAAAAAVEGGVCQEKGEKCGGQYGACCQDALPCSGGRCVGPFGQEESAKKSKTPKKFKPAKESKNAKAKESDNLADSVKGGVCQEKGEKCGGEYGVCCQDALPCSGGRCVGPFGKEADKGAKEAKASADEAESTNSVKGGVCQEKGEKCGGEYGVCCQDALPCSGGICVGPFGLEESANAGTTNASTNVEGGVCQEKGEKCGGEYGVCCQDALPCSGGRCVGPFGDDESQGNNDDIDNNID